jgi:dual specificity protein phosphatase-like protein
MSFPMEDEDDVDPKVRDVAAFIASLVGSGRKVLVHCTEGLNRSGVVIARALMEMGRSAPEAIELVRRGRGPSVDGFPGLGNQAFTAWLDAEDRSPVNPHGSTCGLGGWSTSSQDSSMTPRHHLDSVPVPGRTRSPIVSDFVI